MKKYLLSTAYIIFVIVAFVGLTTAFISYENPFDIYENPLVWIALIAFVLVVVLKEILNLVLQQKTEELLLEKEGIDPVTIDKYAGFKKFISRWTRAKAIEEESEIELDHNYDGIKELDNSLPPWWLYMFYATILFGAVYLVRYHVLDGDDQVTEYNKAVAEARKELESFNKDQPKKEVFDISTLIVLNDASSLKRGKAIYNLSCVACHKKDGGGNVGPNLTDEYWILGGGIKNVFTTISKGGRKGKGMENWDKTYTPVDIQKVSSYVLSLQGTNPPNAKKAQGELWEEE